MVRISLVLVVAACGPNAAHLFPPGGGECTDPKGCTAATDPTGRNELPDEDHPVPQQELGPGKLDTSCDAVGLAVSSLTVGNYATPEERAPKANAAKARCVALKLDADQRECIVSSDNQSAMAYCAPVMFPDVPLQIVAPEECDDIMRNMQVSKPLHVALVDSCRHDQWTMQFAECARSSLPQYCYQVAPPILQKKITARVEKVKP
jgi:hypothetical protein